jgi:Mo-dependent nitrogenase C-terminus
MTSHPLYTHFFVGRDSMSSQTLLTSAPLTSTPVTSTPLTFHPLPQRSVNGILSKIRNRLDAIEISDRRTAHWLCKLIPAQCPFERDIRCFGRTLFHIPPMCKLNPFYDQLVGLRFRALCFLADRCGEDISTYC